MVDQGTVSKGVNAVSEEDVVDGVRSDGEVLGVMLAAGADSTRQSGAEVTGSPVRVPAPASPAPQEAWHDTLRIAAEATMDGRGEA